jgi:hypothetical protein
MRYILAWALGVPFSIVTLWYIVAHAGLLRFSRSSHEPQPFMRAVHLSSGT